MKHISRLWTIWYKPRDTVRQGLDNPSRLFELIVTAFFGITTFLENAKQEHFGDDWSLGLLFTLALIVGPLVGVLSLYVISSLLHWTGKLFGGRATYAELRTAVAHGWIPFVWTGTLQAILFALYGRQTFSISSPSDIGDFAFLKGIFLGLLPIWILLGVWIVVISVQCLSEAQGFSAWLAFANYLLSFVVMIVAGIILVIAVVSVVAVVRT